MITIGDSSSSNSSGLMDFLLKLNVMLKFYLFSFIGRLFYQKGSISGPKLSTCQIIVIDNSFDYTAHLFRLR